MSNAGIHGWLSTNCMAGLATSMPVNRPMLSTKVSTETSSAKLRASAARWSPKNRHAAPPNIGSQIRRLSRGQLAGRVTKRSSAAHPRQHREQHDEAQDHGECVVVQVARLQAARDGRDAVDDPGRAVDEDAVDHARLADPRCHLAE